MSTETVIYSCNKCQVSFAVSATDPDIRLLPKPWTKADGKKRTSLNCPNTPCPGKVRSYAKTNARMLVMATRVGALELYQACLGLGLEDERQCSPHTIKKLLTGSRIYSVALETMTDPNKALIRSITLEGGKTIHIGPSTHGAVVFKVTETPDGG